MLARIRRRGHGNRMFRKGPVIAFGALALVLSACGGVRARGSEAIANVFSAVQRQDHKAFEAALDRSKLRSDLGDQLTEVGRSRAVDVGAASEFALDRMITPQAIRLTAARIAPGWPQAPTAAQIVAHMKVQDRRHVCLEEAVTRRCLLSFAQEDGVWRLVGMRMAPPSSP